MKLTPGPRANGVRDDRDDHPARGRSGGPGGASAGGPGGTSSAGGEGAVILKPGPRAGVVSSTGQHEPVSLVSRQTVMDRGDVRSTDIKIERWQSEQGSAVIRLPEGKRGQTFLKLGGDMCRRPSSSWAGTFVGKILIWVPQFRFGVVDSLA